MTDSAVMTANNAILNAADFVVEVFACDVNGQPVHRLKEFEATILGWAFVLAPDPYAEDDEEDYEMGEDEEEEGLDYDHPDTEALDDDDEEDEDLDDGVDASFTPYRELQIYHSITGAAFQELTQTVYHRKNPPAISVSVTYYATAQGQRHAVFRHIFLGDFYMKDELSGRHDQVGKLEMTTHMEVFGSETYIDPNDASPMLRLAQEYSSRGDH